VGRTPEPSSFGARAFVGIDIAVEFGDELDCA
jgi:hypothetical protein